MYLSYIGIRVTNLEKSLEFYTKFFGLKEVARGDNSDLGGGTYVLLKDEKSGQKLELNWYPLSSEYNTTYTPGDGLDHVAFGVEDVIKTIKELSERGVEVAQIPPSLAEQPGLMRNPTDRRVHIAYVKDPDGNWVELYTHPGLLGTVIPESY